MRKIQLLVVGMALGFSGMVQAGTTPQVDGSIAARQSAVAFANNVERQNGRNLDSIRMQSIPFYLESSRVSDVPEPEGWAMMLMGAGLIVYQIRRRKRARESWDLH